MDRKEIKIKIIDIVNEIDNINLLYLIFGYVKHLKKKEQ